MNNILHIGDKIDTSKSVENVFRVTLLPLDIFDFWERCSAFSDFVADYFQHYFANRSGYPRIFESDFHHQ